MYKLLSIVLVGILIFSAEAFIFDNLLGGCQSDSDCTNGCCLKTGSFGGHSCHPYLLPGASCYEVDYKHCGCTNGYMCEAAANGIALEAGTKIEGYCKPANGTTGGPQIAVEGGR